jgi:hypothetical protein
MNRTPLRTATKLLRLHPDELARITVHARACGQTPARFIRETALGATPKARRHVETEPLLRALARIGSSLEQVAHLSQSGRGAALAERVAAALEAHVALVEQVVHDGRRAARRSSR